MAEDFSPHRGSLTSPARDAVIILSHEFSASSSPMCCLCVGGVGTLRVRIMSGAVADFTSIQGGAIYPLRLLQVMATGTTATRVIGLL